MQIEMEQRLKTLAKTLHDAANEAEKCCEYKKEMDELRMSVDMLRTESKQLRKKLQDEEMKTSDYEAIIAKEKEHSSNLTKRLEETREQNALRESIEKAKHNDISDNLRPMKVVEIYDDLCDNQWCDAMEILFKQDIQENKAIAKLLQVLENIMGFCKTQSEQQDSKLQQALLLTETKVDKELFLAIPRHLEYCKKELSSMSIEKLFEMYISNIDGSRDSGVKVYLKIKPFVKECIRTCWLCLIQHPPLHIDFESDAKGKPFNSDAYRYYTKSGKYADYIVWPTLHLYENGPVLAKGIAQGFEILPESKTIKRKIPYPKGNLFILSDEVESNPCSLVRPKYLTKTRLPPPPSPDPPPPLHPKPQRQHTSDFRVKQKMIEEALNLAPKQPEKPSKPKESSARYLESIDRNGASKRENRSKSNERGDDQTS